MLQRHGCDSKGFISVLLVLHPTVSMSVHVFVAGLGHTPTDTPHVGTGHQLAADWTEH